jgi:penicillin amidase
LIFSAIVVVLAMAAVASLAVGTVRQSYPQVEGRLTLPGLSAPVEVLRDAYGVPQIYADSAEDLFQAQGFVHAQDRFYEMDVRRHIAAGRLSELFGPSQVPADSYIRTLGWRRVAEQELTLLSSSTRRYLDAYAAGVNSYLKGRPAAELSLEYSLLGIQGLDYVPEEWTAVDSIAWLKVLAWELASNLATESELGVMTAKVGKTRAAGLLPEHPLSDVDPIVREGAVSKNAFDPGASPGQAGAAPSGLPDVTLSGATAALSAAAQATRTIPRTFASTDPASGTGSNSWAVSGDRTASGAALLSNDPHLATSIPSVFTQVGLHCREVRADCPYDVSGFSLASVPGVLIGKNTSIAWGLSTAYADTTDLFLEEVRGDTVRRGRAFEPLTVRTEEIRVRGEVNPRPIRIRSSRHGPLLSDVDGQLQQVGAAGAPAPYAVALGWMGLTPGRTMDAVFRLGRARNFTEFRAAARLMAAPVQNLIYADTLGNIGYQLAGAIPRRGEGDGRLPVPGLDPAYDWRDTIDFAALPYAYNPGGGILVAANQQIISSSYRYPLGSDYSYGWRSQEILERLEEAEDLTLDAAEQVFYDDTIRFAADVVPTLLKIKVDDPWVVEGQRTLVGWDYAAAADSAAAAYFNVVVHNILKLTFRDEMPESFWPRGGDRWYGVISQLMEEPRDLWWDNTATPETVETRDDILLAALTGARKELTSLQARDTDQWRWGRIHRITLRHGTLGASGVAAVERVFNRGDYPASGGPAVVNAMAYDALAGYGVTAGPAMRMVVDLGDLDASRWVNQSGASGHAFHPNYDDQLELWATNRTWPFVSSRTRVEAAATDRLELVPGG